MQLFYLSTAQEGVCELSPEEARHATQVLRKTPGQILDVVDGKGGWYQGTILTVGKKTCTIDCSLIRQEKERQPYKVWLLVSPTKSNDRFEWFLEKATEIGVDEIIPIQCKRTERPRIRLDRYEKVLVSAMKQSLQAWLPKLHPLRPLAQVLGDVPDHFQRFIGWCDNQIKDPFVGNFQLGQDVVIAIGPEGDFTPEEIEMTRQAHFQPITFGTNRLRTETAAIYAAQSVAVLNNLQFVKHAKE